jgi:Skp family chaperone for outer membrane proteins
MLNRKLLVALVLAAASSASFAAPATNADSSNTAATYSSSAAATSERPSMQFTEGPGACTAQVKGLARQSSELEACDEYLHPHAWD